VGPRHPVKAVSLAVYAVVVPLWCVATFIGVDRARATVAKAPTLLPSAAKSPTILQTPGPPQDVSTGVIVITCLLPLAIRHVLSTYVRIIRYMVAIEPQSRSKSLPLWRFPKWWFAVPGSTVNCPVVVPASSGRRYRSRN